MELLPKIKPVINSMYFITNWQSLSFRRSVEQLHATDVWFWDLWNKRALKPVQLLKISNLDWLNGAVKMVEY